MKIHTLDLTKQLYSPFAVSSTMPKGKQSMSSVRWLWGDNISIIWGSSKLTYWINQP